MKLPEEAESAEKTDERISRHLPNLPIILQSKVLPVEWRFCTGRVK